MADDAPRDSSPQGAGGPSSQGADGSVPQAADGLGTSAAHDSGAPAVVDDPVEVRRNKRDALIAAGHRAYAGAYEVTAHAAELDSEYRELPDGETTEDVVRMAGRLMAIRRQGKIVFATLRDGSGDIQLFIRINAVGEEAFEAVKNLDLGDWVGTTGVVMRTRRGQLSVASTEVTLLAKALRPLPEKFHGLTDKELRYRQRYVDLTVNDDVKAVFVKRSAIVSAMRRHLEDLGYLEVETPILQTIQGGATARPFVTHFNAQDQNCYLRIATELHLKRLLVGGFERVFELGRIFRNEGMDATHNPEFTSLEAYCAFGDLSTMRGLAQGTILAAARAARDAGAYAYATSSSVSAPTSEDTSSDGPSDGSPEGTSSEAASVDGSFVISYQGRDIDLGGEWPCVPMTSVVSSALGEDVTLDTPLDRLRELACGAGIEVEEKWTAGKLVAELYDEVGEPTIVNPTFVCEYPIEVSPLAKRLESDPRLTDRFELVIAGHEYANAFSELNDPVDQAERFRVQLAEREGGDDEAMSFDADFVRALEFGMPPAGGIGIGVDRVVMLLTDQPAIRDVLLFPHMRPEA